MFLCFFFAVCLSATKRQKTKMQCSFWITHFDIPTILRKHYFGTNWHYLGFWTYPQKPKNGETVEDLRPVFNTALGPVRNTKPPNLGPAFNSTAYIYIYVRLPKILLLLSCSIGWAERVKKDMEGGNLHITTATTQSNRTTTRIRAWETAITI